MTPTSLKTLASLRGTLEHDLLRLGERANADAAGIQAIHDVKNALIVVASFEDAAGRDEPIDMDDLAQLVDATAAAHERVIDYVTHRRESHASLHDRNTPTPEELAAILAAQAGPKASATLEECPACKGCTLCDDSRFVTVSEAAAWRASRG